MESHTQTQIVLQHWHPSQLQPDKTLTADICYIQPPAVDQEGIAVVVLLS